MKNQRKAFTLVELIVVIVILAILATIAFLSFSSQSASARDSTRLSDMSNIAKGLSVFNVTSGSYPAPDNAILLTATGVTTGKQGYAGSTVLNMIKISNGGKDPLDTSTYYTYSVNSNSTKFQILGFLEDGSNSALSLNPFSGEKLNADPSTYSGRYIMTKGDGIGILLNSITMVPVQTANATVDISTTSNIYTAVFDNKNSISGSGKTLPKSLDFRIVPNRSCYNILKSGQSKGDGTYAISPTGTGNSNVYCDMSTDGGGWTVFQKRYDGNVDFYRNWAEFKAGFGNINGEFWLGNDLLNKLTQTNKELYIDIKSNDGIKIYAKYSSFMVDNETNKYKLTVGGYTGSGGDSMTYHNGSNFTTLDQDNDVFATNCAVDYHGAWWHRDCHYANLNGLYSPGTMSSTTMTWWHLRSRYEGMKETKMMLR